MSALIQTGSGDFRADYADMVALAGNSQSLVDEVDILLGAQLPASAKTSIRAAVDAIPTSATNFALNRTYTAILLTLASPDYLVQK
jgi:ethanolamine utilization microcompartment shell protein EutL